MMSREEVKEDKGEVVSRIRKEESNQFNVVFQHSLVAFSKGAQQSTNSDGNNFAWKSKGWTVVSLA